MPMTKPSHPPLTLEAMVAWLETQPPGQEYIWQDPVKCLMGQYLSANNSSWGTVAYSELPGYDEIAQTQPWTFGAARERALEHAKTLQLTAQTPQVAPTLELKATHSELVPLAPE